MEAALHAGGWRVEPTWCDLDGTGERAWYRTVDPWGVERWLTTAQLQDLLHAHGLDVGDLTVAEQPAAPRPPRRRDADDGCE